MSTPAKIITVVLCLVMAALSTLVFFRFRRFITNSDNLDAQTLQESTRKYTRYLIMIIAFMAVITVFVLVSLNR